MRTKPTIDAQAVTYLTLLFVLWLFCLGALILGAMQPAHAHDWFPARCCNGGDCRVITSDQVHTTKQGFVFPGNPEVVPYSSAKIKQTPPEGEGAYAICTKGGVADAPIICLYIPTWGV